MVQNADHVPLLFSNLVQVLYLLDEVVELRYNERLLPQRHKGQVSLSFIRLKHVGEL